MASGCTCATADTVCTEPGASSSDGDSGTSESSADDAAGDGDAVSATDEPATDDDAADDAGRLQAALLLPVSMALAMRYLF